MKTNIFRYAFTILAVLAALSSCGPKENDDQKGQETVKPVFPTTVVNETVAAGQSVDLKFETNMDWKVEISGDGKGNIFWLDDAGMKATSISSKKTGPQVVTVVFSENEEFDKNRVCDVTLSMGGESKKIATYTRPSQSRTFEVYAGVPGEYEFTKEAGSYVYTDATVTSSSLVTFMGDATYALPLKVVTNYAWQLIPPSWVSCETLSGQAGTTEILLTAELSMDIADGMVENLKFADATNLDTAFEVELTMPAFRDRVEYTPVTTFNFDVNGHVENFNGSFIEIPAVFELMSTAETQVRVVDWNESGQYYGTSFSSWPEVTRTMYDNYTEDDILAKYTVEISVGANETFDDKYADIFVIPASKAAVPFEDWFDANTGNLKDEFQAFIVGRIFQPGLDRDYITLSEDDEIYEVELAKYTDSPWWSMNLSTDNLFELVYKDEYSDAVLVFDEPFTSYKYFDYDFIEVSEEAVEDFWLSLNSFASNSKGRVTMYPEKFKLTDVEFPESFIVFYDEEGNELGAVSCRYTSKTSVITGDVLALTSGEAEFMKLDDESEMKMFLASEYGQMGVLDVYQLTTSDRNVAFSSQIEAWGHDILKVEATPPFKEYTNAPFEFENQATAFGIYMNETVTDKVEAVILLKNPGADGETLLNFAAVHYIYIPGESGDTPEEPGDGTDPEEPGDDPAGPGTGTDPENPGTDPEEPGDDPEIPGTDPEEPGDDPADPGTGTDPEDPGTDPEEPEEGPEYDDVNPMIYKIGAGTGTLVKYGTGSERYKAVKAKYGVDEVYLLTTGDRHVFITGSVALSDLAQFDPVTLEASSGTDKITFEGSDNGFNIYLRGTETAEALVLTEGEEGYDAAIFVAYDFSIGIPSPFGFTNPAAVAGKATISRCEGDRLAAALAQFEPNANFDERNVYELKYSNTSVKAEITIPSAPFDNAAWDNYPVSNTYWLTCKVSGSKMTVIMKQSGLTDYFVFKTSDGNWAWVLVCTCE